MISKRLKGAVKYKDLAYKLERLRHYDTYIMRHMDGQLVLYTGDPAFSLQKYYVDRGQAEYLIANCNVTKRY